MEVLARVVLSLELICGMIALEDVMIWNELISVVNATSEYVCNDLDCALKLLDSIEL